MIYSVLSISYSPPSALEMVDTTTPKDLAEKIEWVGFSNLSRLEQEIVGESLPDVSLYLPRLLALALWKYYGEEAPNGLTTRGSECSLESYERRDEGRRFITGIMDGYEEEIR